MTNNDNLSSRCMPRAWQRRRVRLSGFYPRQARGSNTLLPCCPGRCFRSSLSLLEFSPFCFRHFWLWLDDTPLLFHPRYVCSEQQAGVWKVCSCVCLCAALLRSLKLGTLRTIPGYCGLWRYGSPERGLWLYRTRLLLHPRLVEQKCSCVSQEYFCHGAITAGRPRAAKPCPEHVLHRIYCCSCIVVGKRSS